MTRGLQVLLCALALVLTTTPAWAHCRSENRVWGFSEKSSNVASQETAKPAEPPQENPGCDYDFASGMHKYLYCKNDPVDNDDPSGYLFEGISLSLTLDTMVMPATIIAEQEAGTSVAISALKYTLVAMGALSLFNSGDVAEQPAPKIPDQSPYKQYQTATLGFGEYGKCSEYATKVARSGPKCFIAYRLKPSYNIGPGGYAPWGNILDRVYGRRVADQGWHSGAVISGLVMDNYFSGISMIDWPLLYEVLDPMANPNTPREVTIEGAEVQGFGEITIFKNRAPTSRFDAILSGADAIDLPTFSN